jgi:acyl-CoA hydrolase
LPSPATSLGGKVHGGMVMKWFGQAGLRGAIGWSGQYCVTVALGGIQFVAPILIGDLVSVRCKLIRTGNSSMHFAVDVSARDLKTAAERQSTSCIIIFVALDGADGKPVAVPLGSRPATTTAAWPTMPSGCSTCRRRWKLKSPSFGPACRRESRSRQMRGVVASPQASQVWKFVAHGP